MLTSRLAVPAMALLDADPHGLEIFFVYKYGSLARARESDRLTTPGLIWLGVRPTEVLHLDIPRSALLPLTAADRSKARCLLSRPYVKHNRFWQRQIREILASGRKAEIQCLSAIHPTFLTDLYLPSKIQECLAGGLGVSNGQDVVPRDRTEPWHSLSSGRRPLRSTTGLALTQLSTYVIITIVLPRLSPPCASAQPSMCRTRVRASGTGRASWSAWVIIVIIS
ncbi:meiotic recombination protein SPO11-like isoform X2 [Amphibalanus amphitrite]|uniref:meiotic recombination protein SPO11-like isoform X2 n=1 Tax=Amphibalanus amphitrite TaxID=1232801 RepID=UPI001C9167D9|nr:meiotic recombination protein SPO11-like isoform X2 [Amphibalanus amphitrite]